ncbi:hypothetical protein K5I29_04055 [Flavobacterium agricola]|uniref:Uncharacterized protein n=1 Tax=Flavobacterium agricola TaxID=2870839 RepID=A0ABY6M2P1_9FLAO|nr:hypothetical protein [Flavobacterium agricola]UYW02082.1 hypothetical protein K5I29_04055 [Flavobacterium agricola]
MKTFIIIGKVQGVFVEYTKQAVSEPAAKMIAKQLGLKSVRVKEVSND